MSPTQQPGTGLGLPISRRLATLLDGALEMESSARGGEHVYLILPAEATPRSIDVDGGFRTAVQRPENGARRNPEKEAFKEVATGTDPCPIPWSGRGAAIIQEEK